MVGLNDWFFEGGITNSAPQTRVDKSSAAINSGIRMQ